MFLSIRYLPPIGWFLMPFEFTVMLIIILLDQNSSLEKLSLSSYVYVWEMPGMVTIYVSPSCSYCPSFYITMSATDFRGL
jgi:hypothetical protein